MLHSLRSKILAVIIVFTAVTALIITMTFYWRSAEMIEDNYGNSLYARIQQTGDNLDEALLEIYSLTVQAACDENILELVEDYSTAGEEQYLEQASNILNEYAGRYSDIGSVYLVFPEDHTIATSREYPMYEKEISGDIIQEIADRSKVAMTPTVMKDPARVSTDIITFVSEVKDASGKTVAYIMDNMDERTLFYKYLDGLDEGEETVALLLDDRKQIISCRNQDLVGEGYANERFDEIGGNGIYSSRENDYLGVAYRTSFAVCTIFMETPRSAILADLRSSRSFLMLIVLVVLVAAAIPAVLITSAMHQPLKHLTEAMSAAGEGELSKRVDITTRDEIGVLSEEFNKMLEHLQQLIEQVIQEERLKKDAELEALQYQITPHFMYNTLNSIKYAALLKGEKEIGDRIEDFVELLQASINKKGAFVTVAEELHFLENYLNLQSMRYENEIEVEYKVERETGNCYLPRLVLQPLVENAILHGLDMKKEDNRIEIGAAVDGDRLKLWVEDNGRGMTGEQIENLLTREKRKDHGLSGIGVSNVAQRLRLYYGEQGRITYESGSEGTRATICLPAYREPEKYVL